MAEPTVDAYLKKLPEDRRAAIARVRDEINARLPAGYEECVQYGMISWVVPDSVLPAKDTYNKQPLCLAGLASQKNHMAVYLMSVYGDPKERTWFEAAFKQRGKKLDMGQSCVRFKTIDALPVDVIGEAISHADMDRFVNGYLEVREGLRAKRVKPAKARPAKASAKAKPAKAKAAKAKAAKAQPAKKKSQKPKAQPAAANAKRRAR